MLTSQTVAELLDAFASPDPTPGGGSAAALAGALGASLLAMVAGMPKTKAGSAADRAALDEARRHLLAARSTLIGLIERDSAAYDLVVSAYRRPKETPDDKTSVMDIKARDETGRQFNVEMQLLAYGAFRPRALYYWSARSRRADPYVARQNRQGHGSGRRV